ncbi:MAG TPA: C4-dicarboxylate ABC transporter substrate-binding protein, partial [Halomonas sp.]|nr:C4-dicarboxylate ABC transporter substrate-binding protein [Halomonas sp.]
SAIKRWTLADAGVPPIDIPFHPGAVRYMEEQGLWDEDMQAWNDQRMARLEALIAAWDETLEEGEGLDDEEFAALWKERRQAALNEL